MQKEAERQLSLRNRSLSAKLKIEREEVRRLQQCQHYEEQKYLHSIKRKDREYVRLKDRLGEVRKEETDYRQTATDYERRNRLPTNSYWLWN